MIVDDDRFAAAITVLSDHGAEPLLFDDVGCMLDHELGHPDLRVHRRFVHDRGTRQWLDAMRAHFVTSPAQKTPMMSGIAAFGDAGAADQAARDVQSRTISFVDIKSERADMIRRRTAPRN